MSELGSAWLRTRGAGAMPAASRRGLRRNRREPSGRERLGELSNCAEVCGPVVSAKPAGEQAHLLQDGVAIGAVTFERNSHAPGDKAPYTGGDITGSC
jgi:hypothetical protein